MKIIILGAGQVGRTAAQHLAREEANDVTVVDRTTSCCATCRTASTSARWRATRASPQTLERAGAGDADMIVALTNSDEVNMVACQIAWTLFRTPTKIARIRSQAFARRPEIFVSTEARSPTELSGFAVDVYVSPEELGHGLHRAADPLPGRAPGPRLRRRHACGSSALRAIKGGLLVGQPLRAIREAHPERRRRVVAIYRGGHSIVPDGDTVIEDDDEVFFIAARKDIRTVMREMRKLEDTGRAS